MMHKDGPVPCLHASRIPQSMVGTLANNSNVYR